MTCMRTFLSLVGLLICVPAGAAAPLFEALPKASDQELDHMRGGFEHTINGLDLLIPFSLERLTYINGELVASMTLNISGATIAWTDNLAPSAPSIPSASMAAGPDTATGFAAPVATQTDMGTAVITLVQNGPGNSFVVPQSLSGLATVIQNSLNGQVITNVTTMNVTLTDQLQAAILRMNAILPGIPIR